ACLGAGKRRVPEVALGAEIVGQPAETDASAFEGTSLSYGEFAAKVNRLARHLIAQGVGPDTMVALGMRRSLDLVIGMYAVSVAGGAYVPLDPDHPAERIAQVLDTARPHLVLSIARDYFDRQSSTGTGIAAMVAPAPRIVVVDTVDTSVYSTDPVADAELRAPLRDTNLAYVLFTSGSTGRPKGVAMSHAGVRNQIAWLLARYGIDGDDVYLQKSAVGFDLSVWGFFAPLAAGATLVLATPDGHRDPLYLADLVAARGVTVADFVPSMLAMFAAHADARQLASLRLVFAIGEALTPDTVAAFGAHSAAAVHNLYGPTEAAVSVTAWPAAGARCGPRRRPPNPVQHTAGDPSCGPGITGIPTNSARTPGAAAVTGNDETHSRRWRLVLGQAAEEQLGGLSSGPDQAMDQALGALYNTGEAGGSTKRSGGLGGSAPRVARWLGDIRTYFPATVVEVMQRDAVQRLNLTQLLLEPELLESVEPDVHLVGTLMGLNRVMPETTKATARMVVEKVVREIEQRIAAKTVAAVTGAINRSARTHRPKLRDIEHRVATRGHRTDAFPGLGLKAYLVRDNQYSP
ncbi:DUF4865 family protein, partial [Amycolatopsis sp. NPDC003676]